MIINEKTKIADLFKYNHAAIDAIVSINPHFQRLKYPLLRKVFASRVTIEDAARIGDCSVELFFEALKTIGFERENSKKVIKNNTEMKNTPIEELIRVGKVISLDVRPLLAEGKDPIGHILDVIGKLGEREILEIINDFEPIPLMGFLFKKGYINYIKREAGLVKVFFLKSRDNNLEHRQVIKPNKVTIQALEEKRYKFKAPFKEIDVRYMEMPLPMVTILRELEDLPEGEALFVHHKKVPHHLLSELQSKNVNVWFATLNNDNIKLLIFR